MMPASSRFFGHLGVDGVLGAPSVPATAAATTGHQHKLQRSDERPCRSCPGVKLLRDPVPRLAARHHGKGQITKLAGNSLYAPGRNTASDS